MNESKQRKVGAILSYLSIIATTLIQLLYTPLLIKMLGQSEYGLYSLVYSIIGYLTVLDLGFGNAIVVYVTKYRTQRKYEEEKNIYGMFFLIFCIISLIVFLLGIILYFNVETLFGNTMSNSEIDKAKIMILILIFNLSITFMFNIFSSIITVYEKFVFQKVLAILNTLLVPILMIPLLFLGFKSIMLCLIITAVNVIVMLSNYFYCKKKINIEIKFRKFDYKLLKEMFWYSFFIFLGTVVDKINWSLDQFILGAVSGTVTVSLYSVASQINILFVNLSTSLSGVMLPKITKMVALNANDEELTDEMIKVGRVQYFIIFLLASSFVLFGKEFIIMWVGSNFTISYYIALILIIPLCIPLIQNLGISILQAKNMHKFRSICLIIVAIFNIIISVPLSKLYNGIGAAIGTSISLIIGNVIVINIYYQKKIGINILKFWREILKMTILFMIPISLILIIMDFVKLSGIVYLIVFIPMYIIIYSFISYHFVMNDYEKNTLNKITKKLTLRRDSMKEIISKNLCTGCTTCMTICPKKAISMIEDKEGFKYPIVDQDKCINCGLCRKICPVLNTNKNISINKCYAGYNKTDLEKEKASSGAIFSLIANYILDNGGIVIGASFDENNKLVHTAISKKKELDKLKGSKYLQSDLGNIFSYIKENIKHNKVLFVGTPCQVAGIKQIINSNNLICLDLICHGVPSPKLFKKYIKELEQDNNAKLLNYNFRDKITGWDTYSNTAIFKNGKITELAKDNKYMNLFLKDIALRKSCYNCKFKLGNKYSDITLGDFWGVKKYHPEMYNKKGVSAIIINTSLGLEIFNSIKKNIIYKECKIEEITANNKSLLNSSRKNVRRKKFFKDLDKMNFDNLYKKYSFSIVTTIKKQLKIIK